MFSNIKKTNSIFYSFAVRFNGRSFLSKPTAFNSFIKRSILTFFLLIFSVEQTVMAGNGICLINVALSLKLTITGRPCHFIQMLKIAQVHKITDNVNAINQNVLWEI